MDCIHIGTAFLVAGLALAAPVEHSSAVGWTTADSVAAARVPGDILTTRLTSHGGRVLYAVDVQSVDRIEEVLVDAHNAKLIGVHDGRGRAGTSGGSPNAGLGAARASGPGESIQDQPEARSEGQAVGDMPDQEWHRNVPELPERGRRERAAAEQHRNQPEPYHDEPADPPDPTEDSGAEHALPAHVKGRAEEHAEDDGIDDVRKPAGQRAPGVYESRRKANHRDLPTVRDRR